MNQAARNSLETRLDELAHEVRSLSLRVDRLQDRIEDLIASQPQELATHTAQEDSHSLLEDTHTQSLISTLLSGLASLCFLLVIALVLRTLADNGMFPRRIGALLGIIYAGLAIAYGERRYVRHRGLGALFLTCGYLLVFSVVIETHRRFASLSATEAYTVLGASLIAAAVMGVYHRAASPLLAGVLGSCVAGIALEFPYPYFPYPAVLLLAASAAAFCIRRRTGIAWLAGGVFTLTLIFWWFWSIKMRIPLLYHEVPGIELAPGAFIPMLAAFSVTYLLISVLPALARKGEFQGWEGFLPFGNAVLTCGVCLGVARLWRFPPEIMGWTLLSAALVHLALGLWFARSRSHAGRPASAFLLGGLVFSAVSIPILSAGGLLGPFIGALLALGIAGTPGLWCQGEALIAAHLMQTCVCLAAASTPLFTVSPPWPYGRAVAAGLLGGICLVHFLVVRSRRKYERTGFFPEADPHARMAILPFLSSLAYFYFAARLFLFPVLVESDAGGLNAFRAGESILINLGAVALMVFGLWRVNSEILKVSAGIAVIGTLSVFGRDFWNLHGVPLVLSVCSAGCTISVGSLVWGKLQRSHQTADSV